MIGNSYEQGLHKPDTTIKVLQFRNFLKWNFFSICSIRSVGELYPSKQLNNFPVGTANNEWSGEFMNWKNKSIKH